MLDENEFDKQEFMRKALREPTMVTFYIPMPYPVGFPDREQFHCERNERILWLDGMSGIFQESSGEIREITGYNWVSLMFKRRERTPSLAGVLMERAASMLDQITGAPPMADMMRTMTAEVDSTVIEATTVLIRPPSGKFNEALADALERVFDECTNLLISYQVRTNELPIELPNRLNCIPWVPYVLRTGNFSGDQSFENGDLGFYSVNDGESLREEHYRPVEDKTELQRISYLANRRKMGDPTVGAYHELFRARRACFLQGDFQSSVISSYSAIEFFFGAILSVLNWEIGSERSTVRGWFEHDGFAGRLTKRYHPLLGGNWTKGKPHTLVGNINSVGQVRNSAVHAGHLTSESDARDGLVKATKSIDTLKDMVFMKLYKFPKTNLLVFGQDELASKSGWTNRMKNLFADTQNPEKDVIAAYMLWVETSETQ